MEKITYSIIEKNKKVVKIPKLYGRIRAGKRERLVPLGRNMEEAQKWLKRARRAYEEACDLEAEGKDIPPELLARVLTVDSDIRVSSVSSQPAEKAGGTLELWEGDMRLRNIRETTIANYLRAVSPMLRGKDVATMNAQQVKEMVGQKKVAPNTRRFICNALKSLFLFCKRQDLVEALPHIKYEQKDRSWWTEEQMDDIILHVRSDTAARTIEYKDYFRVMATIGSRQGETYLLRWKDLHDGCLTFVAEHTKSRKERTVPIPFDLWSSLEVRRGNPEEKMFPLVSPSQSRRYRVLRRALDELGLDGGLHTFRHSVSMLLFKKCGDIKSVCQVLGHSPQVGLEYYQNTRSVEEVREKVFGE